MRNIVRKNEESYAKVMRKNEESCEEKLGKLSGKVRKVGRKNGESCEEK